MKKTLHFVVLVMLVALARCSPLENQQQQQQKTKQGKKMPSVKVRQHFSIENEVRASSE